MFESKILRRIFGSVKERETCQRRKMKRWHDHARFGTLVFWEQVWTMPMIDGGGQHWLVRIKTDLGLNGLSSK